MNKALIILLGSFAILTLSSKASATLFQRSIGGGTNNAVYDDVLDITWLADANLASSNTFGVSGIDTNGVTNWFNAQNWVAALNAHNSGNGYLGVNTWRLPQVSPLGASFNTTFTVDGSTDVGYNNSAPGSASAAYIGSELAYMYFNNLGGKGWYSVDGTFQGSEAGIDNATNAINLAMFTNLQNMAYWTGTELASGSTNAFYFVTSSGNQVTFSKDNGSYHVWAVAPGDVSAVPVPAAVWLMGSALLGLIGFKRKPATS